MAVTLRRIAPTTYQEWCKQNDVQHAHCPDDCEHPQPFIHNGTLFCGRCWFMFGEFTRMIPCTPDICD